VPHAQFVTAIILVINFGLYLATALSSAASGGEGWLAIDGRVLLHFGAKFPPFILEAGQWWRLVTAGFLHGGLLHILMNSWALFDLGAQIEEAYGSHRMVVFYFVSTVCGFLASTFWSMSLSVGASAGIFGLIGAMIAYGTQHRSGAAVRGLYIRWAVYGLLLGFLPGLRMDNAAHLGGLAAGFCAAYLGGAPRLVDTWREKLWRLAAYACVAATGVAFLQMYRWFAATAG